MPRAGQWADNNREKLREYARKYRKTHQDYFKKYEARNSLKLKVIRRIWQRKNREYLNELNKGYWTREQRNEYQRQWRTRHKEDKQWGLSYLDSLKV